MFNNIKRAKMFIKFTVMPQSTLKGNDFIIFFKTPVG